MTENDNVSLTHDTPLSTDLSNQTHSSEEQEDNQVSSESQLTEPLNSLKIEWQKVPLPATVTLAQLSQLHQQFQQYYGLRIQLIGTEVERVDTAGLQLLLAFINSSKITVGWVDPSSQLCSAARLLGLSFHLGLPSLDPDSEMIELGSNTG